MKQWRIHLKITDDDNKVLVDEGMIGNFYNGGESKQIEFLCEFISKHMSGDCNCIESKTKEYL